MTLEMITVSRLSQAQIK